VATAAEANRIAAIVAETRLAGLPVGEAMRRVRAEFPGITDEKVVQILKARCEELGMDKRDAEAEQKATADLLKFMDRAAQLTGKADILPPEAIAFFEERAKTGDEEAKALLKSIHNLFLDPHFLRGADEPPTIP
jgi:hypothetical protein